LGYSPNTIARSLVMKKTKTLGLVVTDVENPFFSSVIRFVSEQARRHGYVLLLAVSNDELKLEEEILHTFIERRADGIIIVPTQEIRHDFSVFEILEKRNIPIVFATSFYPGLPRSCVLTDYEKGSYKMTKYLLELGHRKIFHLVSADINAPISDFRIQGYLKALRENGVRPENSWIKPCPKPDFASGYAAARNILEEDKPDAIITLNDVLALGAMKAVKEKGFPVPEEISIAGYDDLIFSSISETPLTTIRQNIPDIAKTSVDILAEALKGGTFQNKTVKIEPELIVRESTGIKR